jgi:DNA-binding NtrC family response regulator
MTIRSRAAGKPPKKPLGGPRTYGRLQRALDDAARREIEAALRETGGSPTEAAKILGITRASLWSRMKSLGIPAQR